MSAEIDIPINASSYSQKDWDVMTQEWEFFEFDYTINALVLKPEERSEKAFKLSNTPKAGKFLTDMYYQNTPTLERAAESYIRQHPSLFRWLH